MTVPQAQRTLRIGWGSACERYLGHMHPCPTQCFLRPSYSSLIRHCISMTQAWLDAVRLCFRSIRSEMRLFVLLLWKCTGKPFCMRTPRLTRAVDMTCSELSDESMSNGYTLTLWWRNADKIRIEPQNEQFCGKRVLQSTPMPVLDGQ